MPEQKLDSVDRALLRAVQRDADQPIALLAERLNISKSAAWRRLQRLEAEGIIRGNVAKVDAASVGLALTVFIRVRTRQHAAAWSDAFRAHVDSIDGVLEVYRMGGDIDYLIKAVVADMPAYDKLYQQLIQVDLFDVTASFVMEEVKHTQVLPL